jgi:hypothetical protein
MSTNGTPARTLRYAESVLGRVGVVAGSTHGINLLKFGKGPALVVFPGMEGSGESCLQVVAAALNLCPRKYSVVLVDYSSEQHNSLNELQTALKGLLSGLLEPPLRVWCQSFGNVLFAGLIAEALRPDSSVLVSPFTGLDAWKVRSSIISSKLPEPVQRVAAVPIMRYIFGPAGDQPDHPFFAAVSNMSRASFARRTSWLAGQDFRDRFRGPIKAAKIWFGSEDHLIRRQMEMQFFSSLEEATVRVLDGAGHVLLPTAVVAQAAMQIAAALEE